MSQDVKPKDWERLATLRQGIISKLERKIRRLEYQIEDMKTAQQEATE